MKNLLLFLVAVIGMCYALSANAQSVDSPEPDPILTETTSLTDLKKKEVYQGWKEPGVAFDDYYRNFYYDSLWPEETLIAPDSTLLFAEGAKANPNWYMGFGSLFDPTDDIYLVSGDYVGFSSFNSYVVDSLRLRYLYIRHVDSMILGGNMVEVVDTLVLQFFVRDQLDLGVLNTSPYEIYGRPRSYNGSKVASDTFEYEVKIPLKLEMATDTPRNFDYYNLKDLIVALPDIKIADNSSEDGSNVCGWYVSFRTMVPYSPGDTLEAMDGVVVKRRVNYFGFSNYHNHGDPIIQSEHYSNSFFVNKYTRDGGEYKGFTGFYPGNVEAMARYINYGIHIKTENLSIREEGVRVPLKIYPNPIGGNQTIVVQLGTQDARQARFELYDALGRVVQIQEWSESNPGQSFEIQLNDHVPGLYSYRLVTLGGWNSGWIQIVD